MTLTIAPADEAAQALVARINAGSPSLYMLAQPASYSRTEVDPLEEFTGLRVDVVIDTESQPSKQFDLGDNSSHKIKVTVRKKISDPDTDVPPLALLVRQLWLQLLNYNTSDSRVQVWECDPDEKQNPDKGLLNYSKLFFSSINLRVEVMQ